MFLKNISLSALLGRVNQCRKMKDRSEQGLSDVTKHVLDRRVK